MLSALYFVGGLAAAVAQTRKLVAPRGHKGVKYYAPSLRRMLVTQYCKKYDCYYPEDRAHWADNRYDPIAQAAWEDKKNMDYVYQRNQHAHKMNERLGYQAYSMKFAESAFGYDPYSYAIGTYGMLAGAGLENAASYDFITYDDAAEAGTNGIDFSPDEDDDEDGSYVIDFDTDDDYDESYKIELDTDDDDEDGSYEIEFDTDDDEDDDDDDDNDDDGDFSGDNLDPVTNKNYDVRVQEQQHIQNSKKESTMSPVVAGIIGGAIGVTFAAVIAGIVVAVILRAKKKQSTNNQEEQLGLTSQKSFGSINIDAGEQQV